MSSQQRCRPPFVGAAHTEGEDMGTLVTAPGRWEWHGTYYEKHVPKGARFLWDATRKVWWTSIPELAMKLLEYADPPTRAALSARLAHETQALDASRAETADYPVPAPPGCEYRPFQIAAVQYALNTRSGNCLFGDEMGLGKTIEALGTINALPENPTTLVVCPATVKQHWAQKAREWLLWKPNVYVWGSGDELLLPTLDVYARTVHITNWEMLAVKDADGEAHARPQWLALRPDILILDESHRMKSAKAQRTIAALEIAQTAERIWCLTGTPITNRPVELWNMLHMLDPEYWKSRSWYVKRYCNAHQETVGYRHPRRVWDEGGASNLDELQERLRKSVMVRRRKADVLKELPAKTRSIIELDATKYGAVLAEEARVTIASRESVAAIRKRMLRLDPKHHDEAYKAAVAELHASFTVAFTEISRVRHLTALAKVGDVVDFVEDALESERKVILYAHHLDVNDRCAKALNPYGVVTLTGADSQEARNEAIRRFQEDPAIRVFIGSTQAAGLGITLTAASTVIFAELDWVPANLSQAEDRAHRIGQASSVSVYHLVVDGSLDARMASVIVEKQDIIDRALDVPTAQEIKPFEVLGIQGVT